MSIANVLGIATMACAGRLVDDPPHTISRIRPPVGQLALVVAARRECWPGIQWFPPKFQMCVAERLPGSVFGINAAADGAHWVGSSRTTLARQRDWPNCDVA
jgi:hypothetical protein